MFFFTNKYFMLKLRKFLAKHLKMSDPNQTVSVNCNASIPSASRAGQTLFSILNIKDATEIIAEPYDGIPPELWEYIKDEKTETAEIISEAEQQNISIISQEYAIVVQSIREMENATDSKTLIKSSNNFLRSANKILRQAKSFETTRRVAPDYDPTKEMKIHSLGWYTLMLRQHERHLDNIERVIQTCGLESSIINQLSACLTSIRSLRKHAEARFPADGKHQFI